MKNILLISPLYPIPSSDNRTTQVCHFFARDWKRIGYNVISIHFQHEYPWAWHMLIKLFGNKINHRLDGIFYGDRLKKAEHYTMDGVHVYRMPVSKLFPGRFPKRSLKQFRKELKQILENNSFVPDLIVGHMLSIDVIPYINELYHAKTCMVSHGEPINKKRFPEYRQLIDSYDLWGFRSKAIQKNFENNCGSVRKSFICYSGIPEYYITDRNHHEFQESLSRFLYVGTLISRKYPAVLPEALNVVYPQKDFSLTYVGDGEERLQINNLVEELDLSGNVKLLGKIPRENIVEKYDEAECFIMISRNEAYGLVYLEAMARGCIVIASRNEGIDGIVVDGVNGFLCNAGDVGELAEVIKYIKSLSTAEKQMISDNAIETAKRFTDEKAARLYLDNLEK